MTITEIDLPEFDDTCPNCGAEMSYISEDIFDYKMEELYRCPMCNVERVFVWELVEVKDNWDDVEEVEEDD